MSFTPYNPNYATFTQNTVAPLCIDKSSIVSIINAIEQLDFEMISTLFKQTFRQYIAAERSAFVKLMNAVLSNKIVHLDCNGLGLQLGEATVLSHILSTNKTAVKSVRFTELQFRNDDIFSLLLNAIQKGKQIEKLAMGCSANIYNGAAWSAFLRANNVLTKLEITVASGSCVPEILAALRRNTRLVDATISVAMCSGDRRKTNRETIANAAAVRDLLRENTTLKRLACPMGFHRESATDSQVVSLKQLLLIMLSSKNSIEHCEFAPNLSAFIDVDFCRSLALQQQNIKSFGPNCAMLIDQAAMFRNLQMACVIATRETLQSIACFVKTSTSLRELKIRFVSLDAMENDLDRDIIAKLGAALGQSKTLEKLTIETLDELAMIGEGWHFPVASLVNGAMNCTSLRSLCLWLACNDPTELLNFVNCNTPVVVDVGAWSAAVVSSGRLTSLEICSDGRIDDADVIALADMVKRNSTLKEVLLRATSSREAIDALVDAVVVNNTLVHVDLGQFGGGFSFSTASIGSETLAKLTRVVQSSRSNLRRLRAPPCDNSDESSNAWWQALAESAVLESFIANIAVSHASAYREDESTHLDSLPDAVRSQLVMNRHRVDLSRWLVVELALIFHQSFPVYVLLEVIDQLAGMQVLKHHEKIEKIIQIYASINGR